MMKEIWEKTKAAIRAQIPTHSFRMWIEPVEYLESRDDRLVLACPNFYSRSRVLKQYGQIMQTIVERICGRPLSIDIQIPENGTAVIRPAKDALAPDPQLHLPGIALYPACGRFLRKDFTFDRFVVGRNNNFAYAAALSLANQKDLSQNTLYLLSKTGMGKSHLSQAIGHHILSNEPREKVYYVTAEDFTNEMVHALKTDAITLFKEKYRNQCDVLLLEDIHFLAGKERTQIELTLALDYLLDTNKKIIFTSCHSPTEIPRLTEQLRSRLTGSLISPIEKPDFSTRIRILKKKAAELGRELPESILEYLAGELSENVRQLVSGLIGVTARSSLMASAPDIRMAMDVVRDIGKDREQITVDLIKQVVCTHYNITLSDIASKSRKKSILRPRQVAMYLARKYTDQPLKAIGRSFNRYHATTIHSIAVVEKDLKADNSFKKQMEYLCDRLESATSGPNKESGAPGA